MANGDPKLSIRTDPELEAALAVLLAAGAANRTEAAREAIFRAAHLAERARRSAELRAEVQALRDDPVDRAAVAEVLEWFFDDEDWPHGEADAAEASA